MAQRVSDREWLEGQVAYHTAIERDLWAKLCELRKSWMAARRDLTEADFNLQIYLRQQKATT